MRDAGVGRVLLASLHQGIADILPTRLGFYESWLHAKGLRDGTIDLAPLYAVLSFLRQEGGVSYAKITTIQDELAHFQETSKCTYCHLADVGTKKPPASHEAAAQ